MEFVEDDVLPEHLDDADDHWKSAIVEQLREFLSELRNVSGTVIGSVTGTACRDQFFEDQDDLYGPYATETELHEGLTKAMRSVQSNAWVEMVSGCIRSLPSHEIVLTHSDLAPRNILVKDSKVVAILDWELAGYYPAYWEYVKAYYLPSWDSKWILDSVPDAILEPWPVENALLIHASRIVLS